MFNIIYYLFLLLFYIKLFIESKVEKIYNLYRIHMESLIILILAFILIAFIILNYYKYQNTTIITTSSSASCAQTEFGCCPNGMDSKINFYGTNCPGYVPGPGYLPTPVVIQPVLPPPPHRLPPPPHPIYKPHPIGGCVGTRYGCCPNNINAKIDEIGSNCLIK